MAAPFYYDFMNVVSSNQQPANLHIPYTESGRMFQRYLLNKSYLEYRTWSVIRYSDLAPSKK